MRSSTRRKQDIWFVTRTKDDSEIVPSYTYGKPVKKRFSVSSTSNMPLQNNYGIFPNYDRYFICYDRSFHPVEGMYMWVDKTPELDLSGDLVVDSTTNEPTVKPDYYLDRIHDTQKGILMRCYIKKVSDKDSVVDAEENQD